MQRDDITLSMLPASADAPPVRWRISDGLVGYDEAVAAMEAEVAAIAEGRAAGPVRHYHDAVVAELVDAQR